MYPQECLSINPNCTEADYRLVDINALVGFTTGNIGPISSLKSGGLIALTRTDPGRIYYIKETENWLNNPLGVFGLTRLDGGVTDENARALVDAGANVLVAGSHVFKSKDPKQTISDLKNV